MDRSTIPVQATIRDPCAKLSKRNGNCKHLSDVVATIAPCRWGYRRNSPQNFVSMIKTVIFAIYIRMESADKGL